MRPRTRLLIRGCVTPNSLAASAWMRLRSSMSRRIAIIIVERIRRCSASSSSKPRSLNTFPLDGVIIHSIVTLAVAFWSDPEPALKGRYLNSLAFQRQVGSPPTPDPPRGGGALPVTVSARRDSPVPPTSGSAPSGRVGLGGVNLALKRQAIQMSPFQGGKSRNPSFRVLLPARGPIGRMALWSSSNGVPGGNGGCR
jgi:hypothetical protein